MSNYLDECLPAYGEGFDFSFDNNIMLNWYPRRIIEFCEPVDRLLELGIGHGYTTHRFSEYFSRHVVVDGSVSVIERFRRQFPGCNSTIMHAYFENFTPQESFDVIVLGFVLEHVSDPVGILRRYKKFLTPQGKIFVAVPNGESLHRRLGHAAGMLPNMMELGKGDLELGHRRLYSVASLSREMESAGFCVMRKEGIFLKVLTTAQLQSLQLEKNILHSLCEVGIDYPELSCALLFEAKVADN